jgi:hypothetical protein
VAGSEKDLGLDEPKKINQKLKNNLKNSQPINIDG